VPRAGAAEPTPVAEARWPVPDGPPEPPPVPGFVVSTFAPLVAHVAGECLGRAYGEHDRAGGGRTAIVLLSVGGDRQTTAAVTAAVAAGRRVPPLLFFQSVPNAVAGAVAARWGLTGPVVCVGPLGDPDSDARELARSILRDGDADEVLTVQVEQAEPGRPDDPGDRAVARLWSLPRAPESDPTNLGEMR
jgi:hypothetical protein